MKLYKPIQRYSLWLQTEEYNSPPLNVDEIKNKSQKTNLTVVEISSNKGPINYFPIPYAGNINFKYHRYYALNMCELFTFFHIMQPSTISTFTIALIYYNSYELSPFNKHFQLTSKTRPDKYLCKSSKRKKTCFEYASTLKRIILSQHQCFD